MRNSPIVRSCSYVIGKVFVNLRVIFSSIFMPSPHKSPFPSSATSANQKMIESGSLEEREYEEQHDKYFNATSSAIAGSTVRRRISLLDPGQPGNNGQLIYLMLSSCWYWRFAHWCCMFIIEEEADEVSGAAADMPTPSSAVQIIPSITRTLSSPPTRNHSNPEIQLRPSGGGGTRRASFTSPTTPDGHSRVLGLRSPLTGSTHTHRQHPIGSGTSAFTRQTSLTRLNAELVEEAGSFIDILYYIIIIYLL